MSSEQAVYGVKSWRAWCAHKPADLSTEKQSPSRIGDESICDIESYRELARVVSFLHVMNKGASLLFRGQSRDRPAVPSLLRADWRVPGREDPVSLTRSPRYYYDHLAPLCLRVCAVLEGDLPRHRPFDRHAHNPRLRVAPWAVIQHYELWPTPLLDLTSSLRVAASFAIAMPERHPTGYVYVYAIPRVTTDLMRLGGTPDPITYRLSAVCPPAAERPHLQDGFLAGKSTFDVADLNSSAEPLADNFVAKFRLHDLSSGRSQFWSRDFPAHHRGALLPTVRNDPLLRRFRAEIHYEVEDGLVRWL